MATRHPVVASLRRAPLFLHRCRVCPFHPLFQQPARGADVGL